jgi:hypothetical protein
LFLGLDLQTLPVNETVVELGMARALDHPARELGSFTPNIGVGSRKYNLQVTGLIVRAQQALMEARSLAEDREFILWWYGMRPRSGTCRVAMLDD